MAIKRALRVGLVTTLGTNIGDDFIREGLLHVLGRLARGAAIQAAPVNKHTPNEIYPAWHPMHRRRLGPLRRGMERWMAPLGLTRFEACDLIVQCGTPVIWEGCRDSEWSGPIWRDVLARLARQGLPVLNLGVGSCYAWERRPATLEGSADEAFVRMMLRATRLTTVRDSLARTLFASLGHGAPELCCPALLAGQLYARPASPSRKVAVNFMHGGGHYDWGQEIDGRQWERTMRRVVSELGRMGWQPLLVAHNRAEAEQAAHIWPDLPCVLPGNPREYFAAIGDAMFGVFNRLHAAVAAAGLGIPSLSVGTDSRNLMVAELGLPALYVKEAPADRVLATVEELVRTRETESRRLLALRESTLLAYEERLEPFVQ